jgi:hypothetical protein
MPLLKFRFLPENHDAERSLPRLAADHDAFVVSPVHAMHDNLWALTEDAPEDPVALYPGWFRLAFPLLASGGLWVMIFWALATLR